MNTLTRRAISNTYSHRLLLSYCCGAVFPYQARHRLMDFTCLGYAKILHSTIFEGQPACSDSRAYTGISQTKQVLNDNESLALAGCVQCFIGWNTCFTRAAKYTTVNWARKKAYPVQMLLCLCEQTARTDSSQPCKYAFSLIHFRLTRSTNMLTVNQTSLAPDNATH